MAKSKSCDKQIKAGHHRSSQLPATDQKNDVGRIDLARARYDFCHRRRLPKAGSAHAAVGRPVHLGHLASDDISLETPAANRRRYAFSHDDVMARW